MDKHPMARIRYRNAVVRLEKLLSVLTTGDWSAFASIVEAEALELHALMMTSDPSYILMTPNTLDIIQRIRDFRERTQLPVCFTLDAGPNVHVLYPYYEKGKCAISSRRNCCHFARITRRCMITWVAGQSRYLNE